MQYNGPNQIHETFMADNFTGLKHITVLNLYGSHEPLGYSNYHTLRPFNLFMYHNRKNNLILDQVPLKWTNNIKV